MPKLTNSSDLNDYCRSRRAELLKRMKHPQDWPERRGTWLSTKKRRIMNGPVAASTSANNDVQKHNDENGQSAISTDASSVPISEDAEMNDYAHRMANDINTLQLIDNDDNLNCNDENGNISNAEDDAGNDNYNDRNENSDRNDGDRENFDSADNNNDSSSNDDDNSSNNYDDNSSNNDNDDSSSNDDYDSDDNSNDDDDNDNNDDESGTDNDENDDSDDTEEDDTDNDEADVSNNQLEDTIQQDNITNQQVHPDDSDRPLYEGAPITLAESALSIFSYALAENLTGTAFANLLKMMAFHFPADSLFKKTVYKFRQFFEKSNTNLKKHFYCSECFRKLERENAQCHCERPPERSYFIEMPIINQLQNLLKEEVITGNVMTVRTKESHEDDVTTAMISGNVTNGVKGSSIISILMPDMIRGTAIDVMHNVYLGCCKRLTELLVDSSHRYFEFSVYEHVGIIDRRILDIKPPGLLKRMPRSLKHYKYWKASEWKAWFFYYSVPVLHDLMIPKYFTQYLQFVQGIYILNQSSISIEMLQKSKKLLTAFVSKFQALYDPRYMSFNIHSLLHLPDMVKDLGPLWVTSCFPFEDLLGKMLRYVHGTRHIGHQIYTKITDNQIINDKMQYIGEQSQIGQFCISMMTVGKRINPENRIDRNLYILGKIMHLRECPNLIREAFTRSGIHYDNSYNLCTFFKLKKGNQIIYAERDRSNKKFISHCIVFDCQQTHQIGFVKQFIKLCNCNVTRCKEICDNSIFYALVQKIRTSTPFGTSLNMIIQRPIVHDVNDQISINHIKQYISADSPVQLISLNSIKSLCFVVQVNDKIFLETLDNLVEYDQ